MDKFDRDKSYYSIKEHIKIPSFEPRKIEKNRKC